MVACVATGGDAWTGSIDDVATMVEQTASAKVKAPSVLLARVHTPGDQSPILLRLSASYGLVEVEPASTRV